MNKPFGETRQITDQKHKWVNIYNNHYEHQQQA